MADSITEGTLTKWHKCAQCYNCFRACPPAHILHTLFVNFCISLLVLNHISPAIGEYVSRDEPIATIETDKVDVTVNSTESGTVLEYFAKEGENVMVGGNLYKVDTDGVAAPPSGSSAAAPSAASPEVSPPVQFASASAGLVEEKIVQTPPMADSITEGTLTKWHKSVGDYVARDEPIATIETDKVDVTVNSVEAGTVLELFAKAGDTVAVGSNLFKVNLNGKPGASPAVPTPSSAAAPSVSTPATPSAPPPKAEAAPAASKPAPASVLVDSLPKAVGDRVERRVKMNRMRKTIATRLKESQNTAASLTTFNEIDMRYIPLGSCFWPIDSDFDASALMEFRSKYKDAVLEKHGVKLGFMSAFICASAQALQEVPEVNARIEGDEVVYSDFVDISVAVATPKGLVTPVLRGCEKFNLVEAEKEMAALGQKAKNNAIAIEDLAGGTFTISNGGVFGSLYGTPIINQPQSAILGMHAVKERPVVVAGKVEVRPMMYVALTYDHRLIDGREAVTFLVRVKELIEDPRRLLLQV
ncbi:2-oxoglutarate dehydrogenase complex E2 component [Entophlyctis sp. JEL0112]|nr:2-oxoglutarate dehydrogenase complex E2 component [Entophlyctis sp. JEL0112]